MAEQLDLTHEDGWYLKSREEQMVDASLIKFVYRGLQISYTNEKQSRARSVEQLKAWFPEAEIT